MSIVIQALISFALMMAAKCKVTVADTFNITVYHDDIHAFNLSQLFNLDAGKHPVCDVKGSPATLYNPMDPIAQKDISTYAFGDQPEIVEFISNTTIYGIFDNKNIYIQNISLDGESFTDTINYQFGMLGQDAICSDAHLNPLLNRIYLVCFTNTSSAMDKKIYVAELDGTSGQLLNSLTINQDVDHVVQHRLQLAWVPVTENQKVIPYVLVYDQGISSGLNTKNRWALILDNADVGNLRPLGFANLDATVVNLAYIYDQFHYRQGVIVTGKQNKDAPISMGYCNLNPSSTPPTFNCSQQIVSSVFNTTVGYVGKLNTGQYIEVDNDPRNPDVDYLSKCDFAGDFGTANFIDLAGCARMHSYNISDNASISGVEGNVHQVVVKYVYFDNTYAGYSVHNFDLKLEWLHIDDSQAAHFVPLGKNLVRVNQTKLEIHRMVPPFVYIKASDLVTGVNMIRVECKDDDSADYVPNFIAAFMMGNMKDNVVVNESALPKFSVYEGDEIFFGIDPRILMGNDLQCIVDFSPSSVFNLTASKVYDTEPITINFKFKQGSADFQDIRFVNKYAVALDRQGFIIFFTCTFTSMADAVCQEQAAYGTAGRDVSLERDVSEVFGWVFAWGIDQTVNITRVWIFDGKDKIYPHEFAGVAADAQMSEIGSEAFLVLAYTAPGRVDGYEFSIGNPASYIKAPSINLGLSGRDFFCPVDVDFDPEDDNILEVLSVCDGKDQRILRYDYPPTVDRQTGALVAHLKGTIPINFAYKNPQYCSMGTEFVIYSQLSGKPNLQATNIYDDLNQWTFGWLNDDLNLGTAKMFQCIGRAGMFTVFSQDSNQNNVLSVYFGNNQWKTNHRVFNVVRKNLNQYKYAHGYEFFNQVVHVLYNLESHSYEYMLTFSEELFVEAQFLNGLGNTNVKMNLKCTNGNSQRYVETTDVTVVVPNNQTLFTPIGKTNGVPTGILPLEKYVKVSGPLLDAQVTGTDKVHLIGRVQPHSQYHADDANANDFTHFETVGSVSVGVHIYESNSSVFSVFQDIDNFVGTYTPAHGVNAYHFAPLQNDTSTILIAYSTAEPTNNSLQFVMLKDNHRIAIGRTQDGLVRNFTKVRVVACKYSQNTIFYIWAKNRDELQLHEFRVTVNGQQLVVEETNTYNDVHDFAVGAPVDSKTAFIVIVRDSDRTALDVEVMPISNDADSLKQRLRVNPQQHLQRKGLKDQSFDEYRIISLEIANHNSSVFYILLNTESVNIFEVVFDAVNILPLKTFTYNKLPGFDGMHLDGNNRHFVHLVAAKRGHEGYMYVFYHRIMAGADGSADPYWSLHQDISRPFTITNCAKNMSHFQLTTPYKTVPLFFLTVNHMMLNISAGADLSQAKIDIEGNPHASHVQFTVNSIVGSDTTPEASSAWWPYLLILGLLVFVAVGFIVWKSKKDGVKEAEEGNYESLKPEVKDANDA